MTLNNGDKCQRSTETRKLNGHHAQHLGEGLHPRRADGNGNYTTVSGNCGGSSKDPHRQSRLQPRIGAGPVEHLPLTRNTS
ncbi:hypothetical protein [Roseibium aggregatum]|uniref:hypothetical protein n=1 Tax=Roseibium aggregatum TaxID=187304 RepID=UPI0025AB7BB8|nr:hypothetical protein [Roseibium aggregatum]WJS05732.1 hypothetical protein QUB73_27275 [Roseibium aggregatum]